METGIITLELPINSIKILEAIAKSDTRTIENLIAHIINLWFEENKDLIVDELGHLRDKINLKR
jgi:hypothetical protein